MADHREHVAIIRIVSSKPPTLYKYNKTNTCTYVRVYLFIPLKWNCREELIFYDVNSGKELHSNNQKVQYTTSDYSQ